MRHGRKFTYYPALRSDGNFFEYHLTPVEFKLACLRSGFDILKEMQSHVAVGLLTAVNPKNWSGFFLWSRHCSYQIFEYTPMGEKLKKIADNYPYWVNHMQVCVVQRPL